MNRQKIQNFRELNSFEHQHKEATGCAWVGMPLLLCILAMVASAVENHYFWHFPPLYILLNIYLFNHYSLPAWQRGLFKQCGEDFWNLFCELNNLKLINNKDLRNHVNNTVKNLGLAIYKDPERDYDDEIVEVELLIGGMIDRLKEEKSCEVLSDIKLLKNEVVAWDQVTGRETEFTEDFLSS